MRKRNLKLYDICCGSGAFSYGFKNAGYKIIGGIDIDKSAIESVKSNLQESKWECVSIENLAIDIESNKKHIIYDTDIIIAGLPCQGFSNAGNCDPDDERNKLYIHLLSIIKNVKPEFVLIENVRGILSTRNKKIFNSIIKGLKLVGYNVEYRIYDSANFGVPQRRERVFILASISYNPSKIFENVRLSNVVKTVRQTFKGLSIYKENKNLNHVFMKHSQKVITKMKGLNGNFPISYRLLKNDEPSITIISGHNALPVHPSKKRAISPREAARLQGIEDKFTFKGNVTSQIVQVANAVPPNFGTLLGKSIIGIANKKDGDIYKHLIKKITFEKESLFRKTFVNHYRFRGKKFPWRKKLHAYESLITELLLQRTRGEMVAPIWKRIIEVCSASFKNNGKLNGLKKYINKIGIINRVNTIKKLNTALNVMYKKKVPVDFEKLKSLPGIGIYIASAIRTFVFEKPDFPVDSNGFRFISRFFGIELKQSKKEAAQIREFMNMIIPKTNPSNFVYGFLDYCSSVCKPQSPLCGTCKLKNMCAYYKLLPQ